MPSTRASLDSTVKATKATKPTKATKAPKPSTSNSSDSSDSSDRIAQLENEVADLKEKVTSLSSVQAAGGPNPALLTMIYDWFRARDRKILWEQFRERHGRFLDTAR